MAKYYGIVRNDEYLTHTGIKGMKWGVRKAIRDTKNKAYTKAREKLSDILMNASDRVKNDTTGRYGRGNIDLNHRQVVRNRDGSISTERSFSVNYGGKEILLPQVVNGKVLTYDQAEQHYKKTGEHLGEFSSPEEADEYAEKLHDRQDWYYNRRRNNQDNKRKGMTSKAQMRKITR